MKVHCNECGHDGPAKVNSRNQTRCESCYSLSVVEIIAAAVETAPIDPPVEEQPIVTKRKRARGR